MICIHYFNLYQLKYKNEDCLDKAINTKWNDFGIKFKAKDTEDVGVGATVLGSPEETHDVGKLIEFVYLIEVGLTDIK